MKLVEASRTKVQAYVIFGDGQSDERIFSAIASKFNHKVVISNPLSVHETGLSAAFKTIAKLTEFVEFPFRYLIVIDREHVKSKDDIKNITKYGFELLQDPSELNSFAYILKARRGNKIVSIYVAINGFEKSIEENIVKLIEKRYGEKLDASKIAIKNWLRSKNMSDKDFIEDSSKEILEEAFPGIVTIIKSFIDEVNKETDPKNSLFPNLRA